MIKITIDSLMSAMRAMRDDVHTHYISTLGPEDICYNKGECHLRLTFHDTEDDAAPFLPPTRDHIDQILAFTAELPEDADVMIHCHAGISRSTATAIGVCCQQGMAPADALEHVKQLREPTLGRGYKVLPNRLMIRFFDEALGLEGELIKVVSDYYDGLPLIGVTTLPNRGGWNTSD